jgi:hypothetical protein
MRLPSGLFTIKPSLTLHYHESPPQGPPKTGLELVFIPGHWDLGTQVGNPFAQ